METSKSPNAVRQSRYPLPSIPDASTRHIPMTQEDRQLAGDLNYILEKYDSHSIALWLQRLHNAQDEVDRGGYQMEIRILSRDYQCGAFDS